QRADGAHGVSQIPNEEIGTCSARGALRVQRAAMRRDEQRRYAGGAPRENVRQASANQERCREIEIALARRAKEQARLRLAALAVDAIFRQARMRVMAAVEDGAEPRAVPRKSRTHRFVNAVQQLRRKFSVRDSRLIR